MKTVAVLYFGGTNLSVTVGSRSKSGTIIVHSRATHEYGGIINREFVDPVSLAVILKQTIRNALRSMTVKPSKLYVSTPSAFSECFVDETSLSFNYPKRINERDIEKLVGMVSYNDPSRIVINRSAVFFRLDEGRAVINAVGVTAKKIEARVSLITAHNYFVDIVRSCLSGSGFRKVEFISTDLARALYLIDEDSRDRTAVMIHCGMFSSSVSVCCGDGLIFLKNFEQGIAHVINDVSLVMKIDFGIANILVNEAILSVKMTDSDNYEIVHNDEKHKYNAALVNDIIKSRVELIAEHIARLIMSADKNLTQNNQIFICGGNLDAVKGARDFLSRAVGSHIIQCVCPLTKQNGNEDLAISALINMALSHEN